MAQAGKEKPMNIIFILADDHRYDAMGFKEVRYRDLQNPRDGSYG
jgi:hypothetical protein